MTKPTHTGKLPLWVDTVVFIGATWLLIMTLKGSLVPSDDMSALLAQWGIPGGNTRPPGHSIFLFPIGLAMIPIFKGRISGDAAAREFALGILWGGAFFLQYPALRLLFHFTAPAFAVTDTAFLSRTGLAVLLVGGWMYALRKQSKHAADRPEGEEQGETIGEKWP